MDTQEDMNYLKRYVQNHPDNRMAWYLLGRQYTLEGKEAKANYCYLQSGNIYDAYERKQHPLASEPQQMIAVWNRKRRRRMLALRTAASLIGLLLLMLAVSSGDSRENEDGEREEQAVVVKDEAQAQHPGSGLKVVFVKPQGGGGGMLGKALGVLLQGEGQAAKNGLAVSLEQDGKWRKWTGKTRLLALTSMQGEGRAGVSLLDAEACDCRPDQLSEAKKLYKAWSAEQELQWTLSSAITHYRERTQTWPNNLNDLVRPYPDNILSGSSKAMRKLFSPLLQTMKADAGGGGNSGGSRDGQERPSRNGGGSQTGGGSAAATSANQGETALPKEPLSIIIDKDSHQLAVVSGDVIVRSYTVGLGGEKTPSGSFVISEKVRNPNGRDDGEFGSRGMALSGTLYAIHGTNVPGSIGKDESHGCIRMARKDVEELYDLVPLGTRVIIKSGVLPGAGAPSASRFRLQPAQDETNPAVVYRWLD